MHSISSYLNKEKFILYRPDCVNAQCAGLYRPGPSFLVPVRSAWNAAVADRNTAVISFPFDFDTDGAYLKCTMFYLLLVLLFCKPVFTFCPDGCGCDEEKSLVTCIRTKLEVNFGGPHFYKITWTIGRFLWNIIYAIFSQIKVLMMPSLFALSWMFMRWNERVINWV